MPDPLGYRLKIGSVLASSNACVEPEFAAMSVAGVTHLCARARVLEQATCTDACAVERELCAALERLNDAKPDLVIVATPALSLGQSEDGLKSLRTTLTRTALSPLLFVEDALRDALARYSAKRIAISTPYPIEFDQRIALWFEAAGFEVAAIHGSRTADDFAAINTTTEVLARDLQGLVDHDNDVDALVQLGTNVPMARLVEGFEYRFGKPVLTSNIASWWSALRGSGIEDSLTGFGQLMREL